MAAGRSVRRGIGRGGDKRFWSGARLSEFVYTWPFWARHTSTALQSSIGHMIFERILGKKTFMVAITSTVNFRTSRNNVLRLRLFSIRIHITLKCNGNNVGISGPSNDHYHLRNLAVVFSLLSFSFPLCFLHDHLITHLFPVFSPTKSIKASNMLLLDLSKIIIYSCNCFHVATDLEPRCDKTHDLYCSIVWTRFIK